MAVGGADRVQVTPGVVTRQAPGSTLRGQGYTPGFGLLTLMANLGGWISSEGLVSRWA
jgi:hypothetical protein